MTIPGTTDIPVTVIPAEGQTPTPPVITLPDPDPAEEQRRENEKLKKQLADKEKYIGDLQSEKNTLETRLTQVRIPQQPAQGDVDLQREAANILETAQIDPVKAGEQLANLIKTATSKAQQEVLTDLQPRIEQNSYVAKIKADNPDLMDLGLEMSISKRAYDLMQSGKQFKDAVDVAVLEARTKVNKLTKSNAPVVPTPPPAGAVGESGANRAPDPIVPPVVESDSDEIKAERERKRKMGL